MRLFVYFFIVLFFFLPANAAALSSAQLELANKNLHFVFAGDKTKQPVLFIHGTPGGWDAFSGYLSNPELQNEFFMVSIDRLGWGKSKLKNKNVETSFAKHSASIGRLLSNSFPDINKPWIIVGHSLGASLAPKITIDYPHKIKALLLLSGSINPELGKPRWYNYGANTLLARIFLPKGLERANAEIMQLRKELALIEPHYNKINTKLTIIHGAKDPLVSPRNADYSANKFAYLNEKLNIQVLKNANHFLPWNQQQAIIDALFDLSDK